MVERLSKGVLDLVICAERCADLKGCGCYGDIKASLTAALSAMPGTQVPEGWKLVPIEPTPQMRGAFHEAHEEYENGSGVAPDLQWKAMLAASPTPPTTAQEG